MSELELLQAVFCAVPLGRGLGHRDPPSGKPPAWQRPLAHYLHTQPATRGQWRSEPQRRISRTVDQPLRREGVSVLRWVLERLSELLARRFLPFFGTWKLTKATP